MGEESDQKSEKSSSSHDTSKDTDMETMKLLVDEITTVVEENDTFAKEKNRRLQELKEIEEQEKLLREKTEKLKELQLINNNKLTSELLGQIEMKSKNEQPEGEGTGGLLGGNNGSSSAENAIVDDTIQGRRYDILDKIRINAVNLTNYHNHRYHVYKNILFTIFRVPLILLAGLNSFFSVGLQSYMAQRTISLITAVVSLFCGILTSIELLLNLQKRMELEQETAKSYYRLAVEIYTELGKSKNDRGVNGDLRDFLKSKYNEYQNLYSTANTVNMSERNFIDEFELYIEPESIENDNIRMETGTSYSDDDDEYDNLSNKQNRPNGSARRISSSESSGFCPECCRNVITSCIMTFFYCCFSSEQRIERLSKRQRAKKHKERKNRLGISRSGKYNDWSFSDMV